jgi:hypothetical protein
MSMNSHSRKRNQDEVTDLLDLTQYQEALAEADHSQVLDLENINVSWTDPKGRRSAPRYPLSTTILVSNCYRAFRTKVENISLTGVLLKDFLPEDFMHAPFDLVLIEDNGTEQNSYINFRGHAVRVTPKSNRVIFDVLTEKSATRLNQLVEDLTPQ